MKNFVILISLLFVSVLSKADDDFGYTKKPDMSSADTKPVLQFVGDFDVSSLGAATYTVPIDVPAGVGGMQPSLSLAYSSQSSFGLAGQGFDLKGLGVITRSPKSIFYDGTSTGTTFKKEDSYCLNGERLIFVSGNEDTEVLYRPASDPTTKVIATYGSPILDKNGNVTGRVPGISPKWVVITKDGTEYSYNASLSSVPSPKGGPILQYAWYLSYVKDKLGNYMSVKYEQVNYYLYPKSITYGKNINVTSTLENTVTIDYEDLNASGASLSEHHKFALGNVVGDISRRIKSIVCKSGNSVYCEYLFNYNKIESKDLFRCYSVLSSVTKKKGDEGASIKFKWQDDPKKFAMNATPVDITPYKFVNEYPKEFETKGEREYSTADLNGDGVSDIIEMINVVCRYRRYSDEELYADKNLNGIPDLIEKKSNLIDPFFPKPQNPISPITIGIDDKNENGIPDAIELEGLKYKSSIDYKCIVIYASSIDENGTVHYEMARDPFFLTPSNYDEIVGGQREKLEWSQIFSDMNGDGILDMILPYYHVSVDKKAEHHDSKFKYWIQYTIVYGAKNANDITYKGWIDIHPDSDNDIQSCNIPTIDCTSDEGKRLLNPTKASNIWWLTPLYAAFDIDNDGKGDILTIEPYRANEYGCRCYIKTLNPQKPWSFDTHVCFLNFDFSAGTRLFASDYNKDGMIDIMVVNNKGCYIFYNQGREKGFFSREPSAHDESLTVSQDDIIREGDFDGDGYADYLYIRENSSFWNIAYGDQMNNGKSDGLFDNVGVYSSNVSDLRSVPQDNDKFTVLVCDVNNDGLSDIFVSKTQYELHHTWNGNEGENPCTRSYVLCSTGKRTKSDNCSQFVEQFYGEYKDLEDKAINWNLGDFTGCGRPSLLHFSDNDSHVVFTNGGHRPTKFMAHTCTSDRKALKVIRITDAMDNDIDISYESLTNGKVYSDGTPAKFPVVSRPLPMDVVSSIKLPMGGYDCIKQKYSYSGLRTHMQGLGVLGFEERTVSDDIFGKTVTTRIDDYDPDYFLPIKTSSSVVTSKYGHTWETKSSAEYVVDEIPDGDGAYFYHQVRKKDTDIYGRTACVDYEYDIANAVLKEEKSYFLGEENTMYKKMSYHYPKTKIYKGALLPEKIVATQKHSDDSNVFTSCTKFVYNPDGLLSVQIDNYNPDDESKEVKTSYEYDAYGNTTKTTVSGTDIKTISTINEYDKTGRFVEKTYTEPLSTTVEKTYDEFGNILTSTEYDDENFPLTTTYEYDTWGSPRRITSYNGNVNVVSFGWGVMYANHKKYYKLTQGTQTPWVKTWYDSMGREVESESVGAKDIAIKTKTYYDEFGNVTLRTCDTGNKSESEFVKYDGYNRLVETIPVNPKEIYTTEYADRSVTVKDSHKTVTKELDSWGNPVSVDDGFCKITYKYYSNGQPSEINAGGDVTTFEYDEVGNKISMKTSDKGEITYKYNCLGECVYTKDAVSVTQNTQYDELGRVTEKKVGTQTIKYKYGTSGSEANKLTSKSLSDASGNRLSMTTYSYDEYGRVWHEDKLGKSGNGYRTEYEYNEYGELQKTSYWISEKNISVSTDNKYDCYGNKVEVYCTDYTLERKPIWRLHEYTGKKVGLLLLGCNGVESESECDNAGRLCSSSVSWRGSSRKAMAYSYNSRTSNMKTRTGMLDKTEIFDYDDYDRLTNYLSLDGSPQVIDYSGNGNITEKSDYGTYDYSHSTKPHRLTGLNNEAGACPLDTRQITYNAWNCVSRIKDSGSGYEMLFEYDEDGNRNWSKLTKNGAFVRETEYIGNMEHVRTTSGDDYFIYLGDNLMYYFNNHIGECLYLCTDHLGSVIGIIDEQGEMCYEAKYDAWGNQEVVKNDIGFIRGYTGHEEMPEFGLINMNARLYDPMLGRFISPDNFVQMPENSQNFNRYAYCLNNPLKYNDPSGNFVEAATIAVIAASSFISACVSSLNGGEFDVAFVKSFSIGLFSAGIGSGIGEAFGHAVGSFWNEALRAGAHGLFNGCVNTIDNGNFLSGFAAGVASSAAGSYAQFRHCGKTGVLAACTMGGGLASAIVEGGNGNAFLSGAQIGMSVGQFNHCGGDNNKRGFWRKLRDSISGIWNSIKGNPIAVEIEHLKEINLKEVIVNASRNVENPYLFVIKARVAEAMLLSFVTGIGPSDWTFNNDPLIASSLRNSWQVNAARRQYYKNEPIIKNGKFGLEGALRAGTDPIEQFVGGFDISVKPIENGTLLQFRIENTTSFNSLMYHQGLAKSWERSTFPIMGNMRQTYIFTEPIRR